MTHYAIRIDIDHQIQNEQQQLVLFLENIPEVTQYMIGPIEYKKNGTMHYHSSFTYHRNLSIREITDIFRNPLKANRIIAEGKYSIKEIQITEKYPQIYQAYLHYLSYCLKGNEIFFHKLPDQVLSDIPLWVNKQQTDKRSFRQYVIETYKPINEYAHYIQEDIFGDEVFNHTLFQNVELNNVYNHLMKVFKNNQQLYDLGIWKKYMNLINLIYYPEYIESKRKVFIQKYAAEIM